MLVTLHDGVDIEVSHQGLLNILVNTGHEYQCHFGG
jgi:hypothetical protein